MTAPDDLNQGPWPPHAMDAWVPHRGTMSLLDSVAHVDDLAVEARVRVPANGPFNTDAGVPAWVGIEYMAQAVAAHAGYGARLRGEPVRVGFLLGTRRYACAVSAFPVGSVLHVQVQRMLQGENGLGAYECRIVDGAGAGEWASATITVFQPDNVEEFLQRSSE